MVEEDAQDGPKLLSGGNPQVPKGDGDGPVQTYIDAMPGWKRDIGRRLDDLVNTVAPDARKAVKWNQPWYGPADADGSLWWLSYRCYTDYVQVQFLQGTSLDPMPPKSSKHEGMRYLDIREDDEFDESRLRSWIERAAALPGVGL